MTHYLDLNKQAIAFQESLRERVRQTVMPLKQSLGIPHFVYYRVYSDGRYSHICDNHEWTRYYVEHVQSCNDFFTDIIEKTPLGKFYLSFSPPTVPQKDAILTPFFDVGKMWHWLCLHRKGKDYTEAFIFVGGQNDHHMVEFYINTLETLKKFALFFAAEFADVIHSTTHGFLARYEIFNNITRAVNHIPSMPLRHNFIEKLTPRKCFINGDFLKFSKRQLQCLEGVSHGKSMKEIAVDLNVDPRTIETHINRIKIKTACHFKSDLIRFYNAHMKL